MASPKGSTGRFRRTHGRAVHPEARHRKRCLERAYAFLERGDMYVTRVEPSSVGTAGYLDELPKRLDANFLRVEREATPEEVAAEARRLDRRMVFVPDAERGERLVPYFQEEGWKVDRVVIMAQHREPQRT